MADNPNDIDNKYDFFQCKIIDTINKHTLMKALSLKRQKQHRKPWITNKSIKSTSIINKLYKQFLKFEDYF